jgi:hypothetical protein
LLNACDVVTLRNVSQHIESRVLIESVLILKGGHGKAHRRARHPGTR